VLAEHGRDEQVGTFRVPAQRELHELADATVQ
jgi:hypothetical protein